MPIKRPRGRPRKVQPPEVRSETNASQVEAEKLSVEFDFKIDHQLPEEDVDSSKKGQNNSDHLFQKMMLKNEESHLASDEQYLDHR